MPTHLFVKMQIYEKMMFKKWKTNLLHSRCQQWGTRARDPSTYNSSFFQYTLICTKSDSGYMLTITSCKHPVPFVPLLAPNPGDATDQSDVEKWPVSRRSTLELRVYCIVFIK